MIYVLNKGYHNYSEADKFGSSIYVTEGPVPVFKQDKLVHMLKETFECFNQTDDYVLLSGPVILSVLSIAMLLKRFEFVNILLFDAKRQSYVVRQIKSENL